VWFQLLPSPIGSLVCKGELRHALSHDLFKLEAPPLQHCPQKRTGRCCLYVNFYARAGAEDS